MTSPPSLRRRVLTSAGWIASTVALSRALQSIGSIILARILLSGEWGLNGMVMVFLGVLNVVSETGIRQAIIQKRQLTGARLQAALEVCFVSNLFKGLGLAAASYLTAPWVAAFFKEPRVADLIRTASLALVARGLQSPGTIRAERELELRDVELCLQISRLVSLAVTIVFALRVRTAEAFVWGLVAGDAAQTALSYAFFPFRFTSWPQFGIARELFGFGKHVFINSVFYFAILQLDKVFVGRMLGKELFGYYSYSLNIMVMTAVQLTNMVSRVGLPLFSNLSSDPRRAGRAWMHLAKYAVTLALPPLVIVAVFAEPIVRLLLHDHWLPIVPLLRIFLVFGAMRILTIGNGALMLGLGHPHTITWVSSIRLAILLLALPYTIRTWGLAGAAICTTAGLVISSLVAVQFSMRLTHVKIRQLCAWLRTPILANLALGITGAALQLIPPRTILQLAGQVAVALAAAGAFLLADTQYRQWLHRGIASARQLIARRRAARL